MAVVAPLWDPPLLVRKMVVMVVAVVAPALVLLPKVLVVLD